MTFTDRIRWRVKGVRMNRKIIVLIIAMLALGCATQGISRHLYYENKPVQVKNEIVVAKPYTQVWDIMVKEIAKSFFVINNIDKESRIINISFSTVLPSEKGIRGTLPIFS
jgi:hypothetical protein